MNPNIFQLLKADSAVTALLGTSPLRVFPFSEAPQNSLKPYVTYGIYNANPENYIDTIPDIDQLSTQIDIWGDTSKSCEQCFNAIRSALEVHGHMTNYSALSRDTETKLFRVTMEFDFWK